MTYTLKSLLYKSWKDVHYLYTDGYIDDQLWAEYQWCWRNSTPRLSSLSSEYERTKAPSEECEKAIAEYLQEVSQSLRDKGYAPLNAARLEAEARRNERDDNSPARQPRGL